MEEIILKVVAYVGIPVIIGGCIYIGKKLQILDTLSDTLGKVKKNVKIIANTLIDDPSIVFDQSKIEDYSPLKLTDLGEKFMVEIGFTQIFKDHSKDFFDWIDKEEPKSQYDVEMSSIKSVLFLFDKEYFKSVKSHLYNHPRENIRQISKFMGIYVRDRYLVENPQLKEEKPEPPKAEEPTTP